MSSPYATSPTSTPGGPNFPFSYIYPCGSTGGSTWLKQKDISYPWLVLLVIKLHPQLCYTLTPQFEHNDWKIDLSIRTPFRIQEKWHIFISYDIAWKYFTFSKFMKNDSNFVLNCTTCRNHWWNILKLIHGETLNLQQLEMSPYWTTLCSYDNRCHDKQWT